jgi:hypothetical protein
VKKVQDERTQVLANKVSSKQGKPLEEWEQMKYLNPFQSPESISDKPKLRKFMGN